MIEFDVKCDNPSDKYGKRLDLTLANYEGALMKFLKRKEQIGY